MSNYNKALDSEKRTLSLFVKASFYPNMAATDASKLLEESEIQSLLT